MKQRIIFATGNKNKMREIHEILGDLGWADPFHERSRN